MVKATPRQKTAKTGMDRWALPARQARSRATRGRILEAAERVFAEQGYEGARIADIAEAAGCSAGAVYFRFKDKDALFFAIAETFAEGVRAHLPALLAPELAGDAGKIIGAFVERTAANFQVHRGLFRAIVERGFDHPMAMNVVFTLRDEMADTLARALEPGLGTKRDLTFVVRVMTQLIYGFMLTGVLNARAPTKIDDGRAIAELKRAMLAYLHNAEGKS